MYRVTFESAIRSGDGVHSRSPSFTVPGTGGLSLGGKLGGTSAGRASEVTPGEWHTPAATGNGEPDESGSARVGARHSRPPPVIGANPPKSGDMRDIRGEGGCV